LAFSEPVTGLATTCTFSVATFSGGSEGISGLGLAFASSILALGLDFGRRPVRKEIFPFIEKDLRDDLLDLILLPSL
jgi:hypothetical protein